jgi:hypothetical protein
MSSSRHALGVSRQRSESCSYSGAVSGPLYQTEQALVKLGTLKGAILDAHWAIWHIPLVLSYHDGQIHVRA